LHCLIQKLLIFKILMPTTKLRGFGSDTIACLLWSVAPSNKPLNPLLIALDYQKLLATDIVQKYLQQKRGQADRESSFRA